MVAVSRLHRVASGASVALPDRLQRRQARGARGRGERAVRLFQRVCAAKNNITVACGVNAAVRWVPKRNSGFGSMIEHDLPRIRAHKNSRTEEVPSAESLDLSQCTRVLEVFKRA